MVGKPDFQPLPSSRTIEPSGVRYSVNSLANPASQPAKASPWRLPYFFSRCSGNGGDVNSIWTRPRQRLSGSRARSEEHTSELQSHLNLVCRLLLEQKNNT